MQWNVRRVRVGGKEGRRRVRELMEYTKEVLEFHYEREEATI